MYNQFIGWFERPHDLLAPSLPPTTRHVQSTNQPTNQEKCLQTSDPVPMIACQSFSHHHRVVFVAVFAFCDMSFTRKQNKAKQGKKKT